MKRSATLVYTKRPWNLISWAIRWAMPRSRFALALSSHVIIDAPDGMCYEATMLHGVRKVERAAALAGAVVVREIQHEVPNPQAGMQWLQDQVNKGYDWSGAFGLSLAPDRDWAEPDRWYCYELAAGFLRAAGRDVFANLSHIGETALLSLNP